MPRYELVDLLFLNSQRNLEMRHRCITDLKRVNNAQNISPPKNVRVKKKTTKNILEYTTQVKRPWLLSINEPVWLKSPELKSLESGDW